MFTDPAVVTVNAVAKNLVRINQDRYSSEYLLRSSTDEFRLRIRNSSRTEKATGIRIDRHNVELTHTLFAVAPATRSYKRFAYVVFENQEGDTLTDPQYVTSALLAFLTAANITKLMNLES
jgi:hypothetical protein